MKAPTAPIPPLPAAPGGPFQPQAGWGPSPGRLIGMPVGTVVAFSGELLSQSKKLEGGTTDLQHFGWRLCDGSTLLISAYPDLFAAIGYIYGKASNGGFRLPNYEGYFLRAVDPSPGVIDRDLDKRKSTDGKNTDYSGVGSKQPSAMQQHEHDLTQSSSTVMTGALGSEPVIAPEGESQTGDIHQGHVGVSQYETRAVNISVYWLIKCRLDAVL
jgi:microcystin-dependent protein